MIQPVEDLLPAYSESPVMLNEEQLQDLREARNKTRLPQSLSALAIKSVAKHCTRFIGVPDSPLKYLRNAVVQQFLSMMVSGMGEFLKNFDADKMLIPPAHMAKVLSLLINSNVTELDCTVFDHFEDFYKYNNLLAQLAQKNCPKMSKIEFINKRPFEHEDILPIEQFKESWSDLKSLKIHEFICNEYNLELVQKHFPNIEELQISISKLSQAGVDHLVKMKKLHSLAFNNLPETKPKNRSLLNMIISVAEQVPNLQNFDFKLAKNHNKFIEEFAKKCPFKELVVSQMSVESGLKREWPKNLSVKKLEIIGSLTKKDICNLSTMECNLELDLDCVAASHMYQLVESIGHLVKKLIIGNENKPRRDYIPSEIILERILAACPNLEHLMWRTSRTMVLHPKYNLPPAAFKNYKSFTVVNVGFDYEDEGEEDSDTLQKVYEKFVVGTEKCEILELQNFEQQQTVARVAVSHPSSLQQLREVHNGSYISEGMIYAGNQPEIDDLFEGCFKSFYALLSSCHKLEKIIIPLCLKTCLPLAKNPYLTAIEAIDPGVIQIHDINLSLAMLKESLANHLLDSDSEESESDDFEDSE